MIYLHFIFITLFSFYCYVVLFEQSLAQRFPLGIIKLYLNIDIEFLCILNEVIFILYDIYINILI